MINSGRILGLLLENIVRSNLGGTRRSFGFGSNRRGLQSSGIDRLIRKSLASRSVGSQGGFGASPPELPKQDGDDSQAQLQGASSAWADSTGNRHTSTDFCAGKPVHARISAPPPLTLEKNDESRKSALVLMDEKKVSGWFIEVPEEKAVDTTPVRAVRAMIAAAYSDGALSREEKNMILDKISSLPEEEARFLKNEIENPKKIEEFSIGALSLGDRKIIFALAVSVLKADKKIKKGENEFARKMVKALELPKETAKEIINSV